MSAAPLVVAIVGAGGLGVPAAWGMLELWHGPFPLTVHIFDADSVQLSNLHRQTLYETADIGRPKAPLLAERLNSRIRSSQISFIGTQVDILADTIHPHLGTASLVLEATDSVATKFLVNDFCTRNGVPFCYAGAVGYEGQLLFVDPQLEACGCLRCLFGEFSEADQACLGPTCRQAGVLGPVVGEVGFLQAEFACAYLERELDLSGGSLLYRHQRGAALSKVKRSKKCMLHRQPTLNLREYKCPSTFLYTKLALEKLNEHEVLFLQFGNEESAKNVSLSVIEEGHQLLQGPIKISPDTWELTVARGRLREN